MNAPRSVPRSFPGAQQPPRAERAYGMMDKAIAFACFGFLLALIVYLPQRSVFGFPFPVRGLVAAGMLGLVLVLYSAEAARALRTAAPVLGLAAGLGALGIFISFANGTSPDAIFQGVLEVHLQVAITVMVTLTLARVCGPRLALLAILAVIGLSGAVAMLQMAGVDEAWRMRRILARLQFEFLPDAHAPHRPMGLSFSPIQLSTQLCLAFAAFMAVRERLREQALGRIAADPMIFVALVAFVIVCVATGTRSPILGAGVFLVAYTALRREASWFPVMVMLFCAAIYFAWPMLTGSLGETQARVVSTEDTSAMGRVTLLYYGLLLFFANPLGYGLAFQPWDYWMTYWTDVYTMPGAERIQIMPLHNYPLTMLNIYGFGILLFVPMAVKLLRRAGPNLLFFVPYGVHILFHNSGPFYNDIVLWFVVAAVAAAGVRRPLESAAPQAMSNLRVRSREGGPLAGAFLVRKAAPFSLGPAAGPGAPVRGRRPRPSG